MEAKALKSPSRRVLHFLESGGLYGAESVVLNLSREMLKMTDYEPVVGCITQRADESVALMDKAREYGIEAHPIVVNNKRFPLDILRFHSWLRKFRIGLIHAHGYKASIIGCSARAVSGIPILPTCHLWFWGKNMPLKFRMMTGLEIYLYRYFKVVTVVSRPIKQILMERGVPAERIHIIKNGIYLDDFAPLDEGVKAQLRAELGITQGTQVIINLGRLTEQKAHIDIIHAARMLKEQGRRFVVLIVGDGELRDELICKIRENNVQEEVKLLGFRSDTSALLQISDIFLLPSLDEGLPMALLEAMASRVPVVATAVGDIPEVLDDGNAGALITPNNVDEITNTINRLMMDNNLACKYKNRAFEIVSSMYSSSSMIMKYIQLYNYIATA